MDLQIEQLMEELVKGGGSDLHLAAGQTPYGRFSGVLRPMREEKLSEEQCNRLIFTMINNASASNSSKLGNLIALTGSKASHASA